MGRVTEAKFNRRYNVGQYEHEDYTLTAVLDEGDDTLLVLNSLKKSIASAFGGETETTSETIAEVEKPKRKSRAKKEEPEEEAVEEEAVEEGEEPEDLDPEDLEEEEEEEEEEEVVEEKPAKAKAKGKRGFKKKDQPYSRSSEQHKEIFSNVLKAISPDWKKSPASKTKAKEASQSMEGKDFLDETGEVIASFKAEVKKLMK